ncbi:MAG: hypothetical protein MZU84_07435, partial [Sphingobacterium sp.]|nr:hypothetical protein [Sphingobacterium sp.]
VDNHVNVVYKAYITNITKDNGRFTLSLANTSVYEADAILVTTGYDLFDAHKKEEYGYGIYENVITSADLESIFSSGKEVRNAQGKIPKRIGFVHCVGSRDEKVGGLYCSKVCCVTAVKQSIELKERIGDCDVYCFYMDMRMYGMHFENIYKEAQEKIRVHFIRADCQKHAKTLTAQFW